MSFLGLGISHNLSQKCERCGLLYPKDEEECIHCGKLGEADLHVLKQKILNDAESTSSLGRIFLILSLVLIVLFAIVFMT